MVASPVAEAAPLTIPFGWSEGSAAAPAAQNRAQAWAQAWGGEVELVMSTPADDDFVETLAVIEVGTPLPSSILSEPEPGPAWLRDRLGAAFGSAATLDEQTVTLTEQDAPGVAVLRGRGRVDGSVVMLAVGPRGPRHVAVVMQIAEGEEVLYGGIFGGAVDELDDLTPPMVPFRSGTLLVAALLAWLVAGTIAGVAWTRRSLPRPGARTAGRQVGVALAGVAVLVLVVAGLTLGGSALELQLAGSSPWGLATQLAAGGVVMALAVLGGTELWERRLTPVASAPQQGSFAVTGTYRRRGVDPRTPPSGSQPISGGHPASGAHPVVHHGSGAHPVVTPAVTGNTQVGPAPAVTGNTQVGPAPAVTGNTQVGPAPAITGNTKVGPPPTHPEDGDIPVREIIAGAIEVDTQVGPRPKPTRTEDTAPRARRPIPGLDDDTTPRGRAEPPEEKASLEELPEYVHPALDDSIPPRPPKPEADAPVADAPRASQSDLFPKVTLERGPNSSDTHPALDMPLPPRRR